MWLSGGICPIATRYSFMLIRPSPEVSTSRKYPWKKVRKQNNVIARIPDLGVLLTICHACIGCVSHAVLHVDLANDMHV